MEYRNNHFSMEVKKSSKIESEALKKALLDLGAKQVFFALDVTKANGKHVLDGCVKFLENKETEIMDYLCNNEDIHFFRI